MNRVRLLTLLALALACYQGTEAPPEPTPTSRNDLRILGGALECDGCAELTFTIGGPDLQWVTGGAFVRSDDERVALPARMELRRFTGDSGVVLQAHAYFTGIAAVGEYNLSLLTPGRVSGPQSMRIQGAMRVTRAASPPTPPAPPGTPMPPAPPQPPTPPQPPAPPGPEGNLRVTMSASGVDIATSFHASLRCESYYSCPGGSISSTRDLVLRLPAAAYLVDFFAPSNCRATGASAVAAVVRPDSTTVVHFDVTCVAWGFVNLSVAASGSDLPLVFFVDCEGSADCQGTMVVAAGETKRLQLAPGLYYFRISPQSLPSNCRATGARDIEVVVGPGGTSTAALAVTCDPFGEIHVSVTAADPNRAYRVAFPAECDDYYFACGYYPLQPGAPATIRVPPGTYALRLVDVPTTCHVTTPNPASVAVTSAVRSELVFDIACP